MLSSLKPGNFAFQTSEINLCISSCYFNVAKHVRQEQVRIDGKAVRFIQARHSTPTDNMFVNST